MLIPLGLFHGQGLSLSASNATPRARVIFLQRGDPQVAHVPTFGFEHVEQFSSVPPLAGRGC
eukprot:7144511-Pyramimonas_sp.AAC.1